MKQYLIICACHIDAQMLNGYMIFCFGTIRFRFSCLESGLFPASSSANNDDASGYQNAWVRDNVHIAHAHFFWGDRGNGSQYHAFTDALLPKVSDSGWSR